MEIDQIDPFSKAPEVRHLLRFDFLANSYAKYFIDPESDYSDEQERLMDRYSEFLVHIPL